MAESLRFLEEGSSAPSKSGAKVSKGTLEKGVTRALVDPGVRDRN